MVDHALTVNQRSYQKHKEERKAYSRGYRKGNPEKTKEGNARFKKNNPDYHREWWKKNGGKYNAIKNQRRLTEGPPEGELDYARRYRNTVRGRASHSRRNVVQRCKRRDIQFSLNKEWFIERMGAGCELAGIPFVLDNGLNMYSPSVDRIDPQQGYTPENCRMILMALNAFKENGTDEDMVRIATAFLKRKES